MKQTNKSILISVLWLILCATNFYVTVLLNLSLNLFSWDLKIDGFVVLILLVAIIVIISLYFVAKNTYHKIEIWIAFILSFILFASASYILWDLYQETISHSILGRSKLSPTWFRITLFGFMTTPLLFWYFGSFTKFRSKSK